MNVPTYTPAQKAEIDRRNFLVNVAEGALFISSGAFVNAQTVLPALISRLGGNNLVIGMFGVVVYFGLFLPQIFSARHVETIAWKKRWVLGIGLIHRVMVFVMGLVVLIWGADNPTTALWLFLFVFTTMQVIIGIATPGWFEMYAKLTPPKRRGRLAGFRTSVGGVGAFICGLILTWLLAAFPFPIGFGVALFAAFLLQMSSLLSQRWLIEAEPSITSTRRPFFAFLRELPEVVRGNPPFREFIISSALLTIAAMPVGFFTVYALKRFDAGEGVIGEFTLTMVAAQVVSAIVNGFLSDRKGNKVVLLVAGGSLLLASLTAVLSPTLGWFRLVYVFLGANLGTEMATRYNIAIEFCTPRQRSTYIGLMNTMLAPWYFSAMIGGVLSQLFGFGALFLTSALFSVAGLLYLYYKVADPRTLPVSRGAAI
jgi:MFS family permease